MDGLTNAAFQFGSACTLVQAEALRYALLSRLDTSQGPDVAVDLSEVEEADVSLLQILVSLQRTAAAKGLALTVTSNAVVDDLLARAGLQGWNSGPAGAA